MDFEISMDQNLIRKSVGDLFANESCLETSREIFWGTGDFDDKAWGNMVELGFAGLCIPEKYQGGGCGFFDAVLVMEEVGRHAVEIPFFETSALCAGFLAQYASGGPQGELLKSMAVKGGICSPALLEDAVDFEEIAVETKFRPEGGGFVLNGRKLFVPYAGQADYLLIYARAESGSENQGHGFFLVPAECEGIEINPMPTMGTKKYCEVVLDCVAVDGDSLVGGFDDAPKMLDEFMARGAVLKAAEMQGGARAALDVACRYVQERGQFGRAIGSFQVVQHKLVKMLTQVDALRNLVYRAAWRVDQGLPFLAQAGMAKIKANDAYNEVCYDAMVLHGAYGWTKEYDIGIYMVKAKDLENCCGNNAYHERIISRQYQADVNSLIGATV